LKANAGKDRHFCFHKNDSFPISPISFSRDTVNDTLGSSYTAIGGIPPYTYKWTTYEEIHDKAPTIVNASRYLSDYTHPNPKLIKADFILNNPKLFILTVTDSIGNIAKDSIYIGFFCRIPISRDFIKKKSDTLAIEMIYGFFREGPYINYHWEYTDYSSDTIGKFLSVWNKVDKKIKHWVTDDFGCRSLVYDISFRIDTSTSIHSNSLQHLNFYLNDRLEFVSEYLRENSHDWRLQVLDINGRMALQKPLSDMQFPFKIKNHMLVTGTYIVQVVDTRTGKLEFSTKIIF
jgi:hypothetical protein